MDWKEYLNSIVNPLPRRINYLLNGLTCFVAGAALGIVSIISWPTKAAEIGGTVLFLLFFSVVLILNWKSG
jgi:hypothetical protein